MSTHGNLLFGLVALQTGAVDSDRLAETCALWAEDTSASLSDKLVDAGCLTIEQKDEIERIVTHELLARGGDEQATLAADIDGRFVDVLRKLKGAGGEKLAQLVETLAPAGDYEVVSSLNRRDDDEESDARDRYTRTHLHAKGGMGQVWVARDASLGRNIALKELRPDQSDNATICSRFLYEARVTAQLEHPGIVPVYEMGGTRVPFYTMRFVKGRTLCEAIRSYHKERRAGSTSGSVGLVKLLGAFVGVCHAVAYAHSRGYIHRDLKGQNVILGDFGEVIVLDWGIAKQVGPETTAAGTEGSSNRQDAATGPALDVKPSSIGGQIDDDVLAAEGMAAAPTLPPSSSDSGAGPEGTMAGQLLGTPSYMAPEQAAGRIDQVDRRTDVYGLGTILYELLAGQPPFSGKKTADILQRVRTQPPRAPRDFNPDVPSALQAVCLKALSKGREARYPSAIELAQEVERYLADEPVLACPDPWTQRAMRWGRRHRTIVATAAGLLVTSTVALAIGTALVSRERNEAKEQGQQARQAVGDMYTKVAENWLEDRLDPLQKEFLEKTLAYYETFTRQAAHEPAVRLEHGRAYQRMGDIQRKLGKLDESAKAFERSLAILGPLSEARPDDSEVRRALGLAQARQGDLMMRLGRNDRADALFRQAADLERPLASAPQATAEDEWLLARTLKSQADLLRRKGEFTAARPAYQEAVAVLQTASAAVPDQSEFRTDLALAHEASGQLLLEDLGDSRGAEEAFREALKLLEPLVKAFPTVPRFREALTKVTNSLGMVEHVDGRWTDAESHYERELREAERLSQDFPDRPEFRRELARACTNLGGLFADESRLAEAEPILRRGVALNSELAAKEPLDVQFRFDLARCQHNLGYVLLERGETDQAIAATEQARNLSQALAKEFPDPRYRHQLGGDLLNLGRALQTAGKPEAETTFQQALEIDEKLVKEFPANAAYHLELGRCLRNLGALMASLNRGNEAEAFYSRALGALDQKGKESRTAESLREQATVLSNLGEFRRAAGRPGAEDSLRKSIALCEELAARKPTARADRQTLAIAQNNLAEVLEGAGRTDDAKLLFAQSIAGLSALGTEMPKASDTQNYLGYVCEQQGKLLAKAGPPEKARSVLEQAVSHQRQAVALTDGKVRGYRLLLAGHLAALAEVCLKLRDYDAAVATSLEMPKAAPGSGNTCLEAAKLLARCMSQGLADTKLEAPHRDELNQKCLGRIVVLLREALDVNPRLAAKITAEPGFSAILSRPEFKSLLSNVVDIAPKGQ